MFNHRELENKNTDQIQEMCFQKGTNWNDFPIKLKRGRLIIKQEWKNDVVVRTKWVSIEPPIFSQERELLKNLIPNLS
jgi:hypothetical protein